MVTKPVPTLDGNRRILEKFFPDRLQATALAEFIRDTIGTALRASGGATVVVNDDAESITIGAPTSSGTGGTGGTAAPATVTVETDPNRPNVLLVRVSDGTGSSTTLPGAPGQPTITAA